MYNEKYTEEVLTKAVNESVSYAGVLRNLGLKQAGGTQTHIKGRIEHFNIDTSHFTGKAWGKGSVSKRRTKPEDILVLNEEGSYRTKTHKLRRSLVELGVKYECSECCISEWNEKPITLHVDHIDGNSYDDRKENLRFLCPNCHTQTSTFGNKNRDEDLGV